MDVSTHDAIDVGAARAIDMKAAGRATAFDKSKHDILMGSARLSALARLRRGR